MGERGESSEEILQETPGLRRGRHLAFRVMQTACIGVALLFAKGEVDLAKRGGIDPLVAVAVAEVGVIQGSFVGMAALAEWVSRDMDKKYQITPRDK